MNNWEDDNEAAETTVENRIVANWDALILYILEAEKCWNKLNSDLSESGIRGLETFPLVIQKALAMFKRQKFNVMLPRLVDYTRSAGGLQTMMSKGKITN